MRAQFTWGYWFLAALPPTLVVIIIILLVHDFSLSARVATEDLLYDGANPTQYSWAAVAQRMDQSGRAAFHGRRLAYAPYHGIDGAWIAIIAFATLVNTGIVDWNMLRKGIDWELLIHMGVTLEHSDAFKTGKDRSMAGRRRCRR